MNNEWFSPSFSAHMFPEFLGGDGKMFSMRNK